jgi:2-oxoglutarate ferredoxin oxidoreductase subunit beta
VNSLDLLVPRDPIHVQYEPGETKTVTQHSGEVISLHKLAKEYDPSDRVAALSYLQEKQALGEVVTGLLFVDPAAEDLHDRLETVDTPLNALPDERLVPGAAALAKLNASLR